jgi:pimeloyl-ACP methyl ester carboxylesterase
MKNFRGDPITMSTWTRTVLCGTVLLLTAGCSSSSKDGAAGQPQSNGGAAGNTDGGGNGAGGGGSSVKLASCDLSKETSAAPIIDACGDVTTPYGDNVKLGPYGAQMDANVGAGFENPNPNDDPTCPGFAAIFKEDQSHTTQLLDTGPQPCTTTDPNTGNCLNYSLYSVYRPATWPDGPIPVLSWGNGTCAQPEGYGTLLRYIASHGFFVIAANSREVGDGTDLRHAIDFAAAANADSSSPYYGHLDMTKVGVMGHSQGSAAAGAAAADDRVSSAILFNAGDTAPKQYLAISGQLDITGYTSDVMATAINAAPKAAYLYYYNPAGSDADTLKGHLVLMLTPQRVMDAATDWWKMTLLDDATAKNSFVGDSCGLCGHTGDFDFGEHGY